jgi:GNAT superfamily N-acetyltransferase
MGCRMNVQREKYDDVVDYLENLSTTMTRETDLGHSYAPEVDHDQFLGMEDMGMLCVVVARDDGDIIGFHISSIQPDIFYKSIKTAYVLFYYLDRKYRGSGNGLKMFEFADNEFKKEGAQRAFMSRKTHINNEKLFIKLGYNHIEANYEKYYG